MHPQPRPDAPEPPCFDYMIRLTKNISVYITMFKKRVKQANAERCEKAICHKHLPNLVECRSELKCRLKLIRALPRHHTSLKWKHEIAVVSPRLLFVHSFH